MATGEIPSYPDPSQENVHSSSPVTASGHPIKSCTKNKMLTRGQKQVLVDNLQLEITERARRLRAQYVLQAQGLRTRIEIRVNRIPMALRRVKMKDLLMKHSQGLDQGTGTTSKLHLQSPIKKLTQSEQLYPVIRQLPQRGTKRTSNAISMDKENGYTENGDTENLRKRSRRFRLSPNHTTSHAPPIFSPRLPNSGTLNHLYRPASPEKSATSRPASPIKPITTIGTRGSSNTRKGTVAKVETGRSTAGSRKAIPAAITGAGRSRRLPPTIEASKAGRVRASVTSQKSDSSLNTVITRTVPAKKKDPVKEKSAQPKKGVLETIKSIGSQKKSSNTTKSETDTAPLTSGRVLRKRK